MEENLIAQSVKVDVTRHTSTAKLPLIYDPLIRLQPNKHKALKTYSQQLKKLNNNPADKADVLKSEKKLQELKTLSITLKICQKNSRKL